MSEPVPLTDDQIADSLAALDGWTRAGDLEMATHIDAIAAGHGAKPVPPETS